MAVNQKKMSRMQKQVDGIVAKALGAMPSTMTRLVHESEKHGDGELTSYDDYHLRSWTGHAITTLIRHHQARLGSNNDRVVVFFASEQ